MLSSVGRQVIRARIPGAHWLKRVEFHATRIGALFWLWIYSARRIYGPTMATRIGINGFGRMGRLAFRAGWNCADIEFVHLNEIAGDGKTSAHLLYFDSI